MNKTLIFIIVTYIFCLIFLIITLDLPSSNEVSTLTGPATWPLTLILLMLIFNTVLLVNYIYSNRKKRYERDKEVKDVTNKNKKENKINEIVEEIEEINEEVNESKTQIEAKKQYLMIVLIFAYVLLLNFVGFIIATIIFIPLCALLLGMKNKLILSLSSVIATFLIYGLFEHILNVPLP